MVKINFQNLPNTTTPVSAENLNAIQDNAETAINAVETGANTNLANATKGYQTTQETEAHTLTDSAGVKGKIDVTNGKTEQATRTGKNLVNITSASNISFNATTKEATIPNAFSGSGFLIWSNTPTLEANKTYKIELFLSSATSNTQSCNVALRDTSSSALEQQSITIDNTSNYYSFEYTPSADVNPTRIQIYFGTQTPSTGEIVLKGQIRESTTEAGYEDYGVSPSPDYPSDIRNVGDNVNICYNNSISGNSLIFNVKCNKITNKILTMSFIIDKDLSSNSIYFQIDGADAPDRLIGTVTGNANKKVVVNIILTDANYNAVKNGTEALFTIYKYGGNFTSFTNAIVKNGLEKNPSNYGSIDINTESKNKFAGWTRNIQTNSNNGTRAVLSNSLSSDFCEIEPNTVYRMSGIAIGSYGKNKYISYYRANKSYISRTGSTNVSSITQTTPADAYYCTLGINSNFSSAEEMENFIADSANILLEEGTTITSYQEYGKQEIQFPFVEGQRLHEGDYLAEDGIHQVRGTMIFDGTESGWNFNTTNTSISINIVNLNYKTNNDSRIKCNRLKAAAKDVEGFNSVSSNSLYVKINGCTTLQEYKNKLAEWASEGTPLTFENNYIEPVITPYTAEQQEAYYQLQHAQMYEGYTDIECIDEMKPETKVSYLYNNDINNTFGSIIDKLEERVHDLENS